MHPTHIKVLTPNSKDLDILCVALSLVKTLDQINDFKILIKQALNQGFDINMKDIDNSITVKDIEEFIDWRMSISSKNNEFISYHLKELYNLQNHLIRNPKFNNNEIIQKLDSILMTAEDYDKSFIVEQLPEQLIDKTEALEFELTGKTAEVTSEIA
ncbi:MAG TPA: hypothetical protein LFV66_00175 [Rickettsia endosymbiont of Bembidion lapponicum]|nr:hypothetical protein [Rickettsia endosymbiont of Bembidion lapponicum]